VIDLCRGQYMDIHFQTLMPSLEEYLEMVRLKTGVLLGTACEIGALVVVWGSEESLGKVPSDLKERKRSLPVALAIRENPEEVGRLLGISRENRLVS